MNYTLKCLKSSYIQKPVILLIEKILSHMTWIKVLILRDVFQQFHWQDHVMGRYLPRLAFVDTRSTHADLSRGVIIVQHMSDVEKLRCSNVQDSYLYPDIYLWC